MKKTERNSAVELLKLLAIVIIVFSHAAPVHSSNPDVIIDVWSATASLQRLLIVLMKYGGQVGNTIFVVCSAWFLCDSKKIAASKAVSMIADNLVLSVIGLLVFMGLGLQLNLDKIIMQFFPLTFGYSWFVSCYIIYYLLHPAVNMITDKLNQKQLLGITVIIFGIYSVLNTVKPGTFYYNELIGFVMIHIVVTYVKRYMPEMCKNIKFNILIAIASAAGIVVLVLATNFMLARGINVFGLYLTYWNHFQNPLMIFFALSMFNIANSKRFTNRVINYLSSMTLLIYIIHVNQITLRYKLIDWFGWIYENYTFQYELLWVVLAGVALLLYSLAVSFVYKSTLQKTVAKASGYIYCKIVNILDKIADIAVKIK